MALIHLQLIIHEKSLGLGRLVYLSVENQIWTAFFTVKKKKKKWTEPEIFCWVKDILKNGVQTQLIY